MSEVAVQHEMADVYEPSLFGTYSKKIGMWLFLLSDTLTFGALLFAYSYGRISNPDWPTPFGEESITNATIMTGCLLSSSLTMVLAVLAARRGDRSWTRNWILFTMFFGTAFIVLHGLEWTHLIDKGMTPFKNPWAANVPQFGGTFFTLTGMHMLHVTIGVIYLGVVVPAQNISADPVGHLGSRLVADSGKQRVPLRGPRTARRIHRRSRDPDSETKSLRRARCRNRWTVLALRRLSLDVHFPAGVFDVDAGVMSR